MDPVVKRRERERERGRERRAPQRFVPSDSKELRAARAADEHFDSDELSEVTVYDSEEEDDGSVGSLADFIVDDDESIEYEEVGRGEREEDEWLPEHSCSCSSSSSSGAEEEVEEKEEQSDNAEDEDKERAEAAVAGEEWAIKRQNELFDALVADHARQWAGWLGLQIMNRDGTRGPVATWSSSTPVPVGEREAIGGGLSSGTREVQDDEDDEEVERVREEEDAWFPPGTPPGHRDTEPVAIEQVKGACKKRNRKRRRIDDEEEEEEKETKDESRWPAAFLCPITQSVFVEPVVCSGGHSFERSAILQWLEEKEVHPLTRQPMQESDLKPNRHLKQAIQELKPFFS